VVSYKVALLSLFLPILGDWLIVHWIWIVRTGLKWSSLETTKISPLCFLILQLRGLSLFTWWWQSFKRQQKYTKSLWTNHGTDTVTTSIFWWPNQATRIQKLARILSVHWKNSSVILQRICREFSEQQ
jgi:hypothetical protein